ncbi:MAG: Cys/Met metabolism pyridoxal-phosphate-dependent enzyme, partial [Candidatus Anammoxibacter sp.]
MAKSKLSSNDLQNARQLSPNRTTTTAQNIDELVNEQLAHFSIESNSQLGERLAKLVYPLYEANIELHNLWRESVQMLSGLRCEDKAALFNAKRFICFQMAKLLDNLQNPLRKSYQSLVNRQSTITLKGPYPIFDNVAAIFSSTPVITRTATYLYACAEWIDEAFRGKELLHEIYSRLMNP